MIQLVQLLLLHLSEYELVRSGCQVTPAQVEEMLQAGDTDGDGQLSYAEFSVTPPARPPGCSRCYR